MGFATTPGSLEVAVIRNACVSLVGPALRPLKATAWAAASSEKLKALSGESVGASFTGVTPIRKIWTTEALTPPPAVPPLSRSVAVTLAEPWALSAVV